MRLPKRWMPVALSLLALLPCAQAQDYPPRPIVDKLHRELMAVMAMPETKAQIAKLSLLALETPSVDEMQHFVKSEIVRWGKIVKQAGIAGSQ